MKTIDVLKTIDILKTIIKNGTGYTQIGICNTYVDDIREWMMFYFGADEYVGTIKLNKTYLYVYTEAFDEFKWCKCATLKCEGVDCVKLIEIEK